MDAIQDSLEAGIAIGRQQAFAVISAKCSAAQALTLKNIKDSRAYEALGCNWNDYCPKYFGISRVTADRIIHQLEEFGQAYFRLGELARITEAGFREIASNVTSEAIEFEGEMIPLTPENAPRIRSAVRELRRQLREAQSEHETRCQTVPQFLGRLDALLFDMRRLNAPLLSPLERQSLRGLAHYAVEKWTEIARTYDKAG
jgi:hypothetical protein